MSNRDLNFHDPGDRERHASEWLRYADAGNEDCCWVDESLPNLIDEDPSLAWSIILELVHRAPSDREFDFAAAGPLEDLIVRHGEKLIEVIEQRLQGDKSLRRAITKVWLNEDDLDRRILERYW